MRAAMGAQPLCPGAAPWVVCCGVVPAAAGHGDGEVSMCLHLRMETFHQAQPVSNEAAAGVAE